MANYSQELAQDAVCQSHAGHMTGLWFLPARPLRLNTNEWMNKNCVKLTSFLTQCSQIKKPWMMMIKIICLGIIISSENIMRGQSTKACISIEWLTRLAAPMHVQLSEGEKINEFCCYRRTFYNAHSDVIACVRKWTARRSVVVHVSSK